MLINKAENSKRKQLLLIIMMSHKILFLLFAITFIIACKEHQSLKNVYSCNKIDDGSLVELKGVAYVNTKDTIVFHKLDFIQNNRYGRKMHLIPCNKNLKNQMFKEYDIFIYLKNHSDNFWVSIEGQYLTPDTLKRPQQFLLRSFTIIDSIEAVTIGNQAVRNLAENKDLINKIKH